ncbi:pyrimidine utilization protein D [Asticcacaulis sp. AC460]|uniref:pyrimidine utilization protein D n=1 Tax=Asticcacaulis sp. AC460 TaxID=1282360 RepID=UPI00190FB5AF|nr:pyrimidine utilization protein D [Asticcacaulis sp. AC460]
MAPVSDGEFQFINGLAVTVYGSGEPVIMSAGLGGLGAYWRPQLSALSGYQVVLYDHRGTGESARDIGDDYSAADLADDLYRIITGLDLDSAHVVGHAAGGIAGLQLALDRPQVVKSLTVVNGWAKADRHFKRCFDIRLGIYEAGGPEAYLRAQPIFLFPAEWISAHLDELDAQAAHHAAGFQSEATLRARIRALAEFDISQKLEEIQTPTLVIAALDDMLVPVRSSVALSDGLPDSQFVGLPWGGHACNVTVPEDFNGYLTEFLKVVSQQDQG